MSLADFAQADSRNAAYSIVRQGRRLTICRGVLILTQIILVNHREAFAVNCVGVSLNMPQDEQEKNIPVDPNTTPYEILPPVEAPSAGFLLQLFLIPMVIVGIIVMVWLMFSWLAHMGNDPADLVQSMRRGSEKSWQDAATLADLLRDPRKEELRQSPELAKQLSELLREQLSAPISTQAKIGEQQIQFRCFLCKALGEFHIADGLPVLIEAMNQEDDQQNGSRDLTVREYAIQAVAVLAKNVGVENLRDDDDLRSSLMKASKEEDEFSEQKVARAQLRIASAYAMGVIGGEANIDRLYEMLSDPYPNVSFNAATGLARHGDPRAIPILIAMLDPGNKRSVEGEREIDQDWKRVSVMVNAIRAAKIYANVSPAADLSELETAIGRLTESDLPLGVQVEAKETLIIWQDKREAVEGAVKPSSESIPLH
ncbi:MAG: hypothetical protein ACI9G1_000319 [Pirellulaceae bacterium]